jgi:hypothetical protein
MMVPASVFPGGLERFATKVYLLWAGLAIGVAFLATPAKFLAPSLSLPVALDVGRQTFRVYNGVELVLLGALLVLGGWSNLRRRWYLGLVVPGAIVISQALWLIPALDLRVAAIQAGQSPLPASNLHVVYIAAEAIKVLWLLAMGLGEISSGWGRARGLGHRAQQRGEIQTRGRA